MTELRSPFDLSGKRAVVTGASRGIGQAIAVALARSGADVVGVSSTITDDGETGAAVRAEGRSFQALRADLADRRAVTDLASTLTETQPPIDILVNNAGVIRRAPAAVHSEEDWDLVLQVDLTAQFLLARHIGATMVRRGSGKIIFTASLLSYQGGILVPGYAAVKHGVLGVVKALANEWAGSGVNVNALAPGYIATDNTAALRDDPQRSGAILDRIPAGRWGDPSDLAWSAVYLASAAADYVHGATLPVDGGWLGR
ncbi:SDR family oxidoreductase [Streptomyces sp. NPDC019224]|uniref:SDR family oxidoreductase n=1 Tax=Streptomyces sp. NPDC019224 TaxID=3154484 RepID=UPI0033D003DB